MVTVNICSVHSFAGKNILYFDRLAFNKRAVLQQRIFSSVSLGILGFLQLPTTF